MRVEMELQCQQQLFASSWGNLISPIQNCHRGASEECPVGSQCPVATSVGGRITVRVHVCGSGVWWAQCLSHPLLQGRIDL